MPYAHCVLCYAPHTDIDYTVYADNRPSGLPARAQFSSVNTMKTGLFMPTVGGPPDCVTEILYVMVSLLVCAH